MHRRPEGDPRLVRADVRGGALAADVLFASLEREGVGPPAGRVLARPDEPAGDLPEVGRVGRDEPEVVHEYPVRFTQV